VVASIVEADRPSTTASGLAMTRRRLTDSDAGYISLDLPEPPLEGHMLAIAAACVFGFTLLLDLLNTDLGARDLFNWQTLTLIGLLLLALHLGGVGHGTAGSGRRWYRGRRPGRG